MNIVIVNDYANIEGGATQVAVSSARELADTGYKVTYIYAVGTADILLEHPNIKLIDFKQYDLLSNPSKFNASIVGLWNYSVEKQMKEFLNSIERKDTVIHIHSWTKALSVSVISTIINSKTSFVMSMHDYFSICPNGGLYNYQEEKACDLSPMSVECLISNCDSRNYSYKLWRVLRQFISEKFGMLLEVKNFITVSEFSKEILEPYLSEDAKIWSIPNPISIQKERLSFPDKFNCFSFVGRLSKEKGAESLAYATKELNVQTRFVGAGEMLEELKTINPNAEFVGWVNRKNVVKYIQSSRALVFPSKLYETQGMAVLEASALGVPSIVSNSCAASKFIEDGKTGILFEAGNIQSLREKIKMLNEDPNLAKEIGQNAYEYFWSRSYDLSSHAKSLIECYKSILKNCDVR